MKTTLTNNWKLYIVKDSDLNPDNLDFAKYQCFNNVSIPTLLELELYRNHILGHPYESTNIWKYHKYEDYHQFYVVHFNSNRKQKVLILNGVDTIADVFVNGELVGKTENMFISYSFNLRNLKKDNELIIHIYPSVLEGRKYKITDDLFAFKYNYESLNIRKCPSSFGWDILPRTALGGIYKTVEIVDSLPIIEDVHVIAANISKESANLKFDITYRKIGNYETIIEGKCGKQLFFTRSNKIKIHNPKLWNIRGYGKPNLYKIKVKLYENGKLIETKSFRYGIRKVELKRTSTVQENGYFEFYINDRKVFLMGCNWVPVEAIKHIDDERMLVALNAVEDLNCNTVRVWGGGTYESDRFYEECDKRGIFIWHDFMMGCASYPQTPDFKRKLKTEINYIVKKLRNHPSICLWAGDNEDDLAIKYWAVNKRSPSTNSLTRELIPNILKKEDNYRPYLPSSPYIDEYAEAHPKEPLSEDHLWGPRDYFKGEFYGNAVAYFTSEIGYHSLSCLDSLQRYLHKPWPFFEGEIEKDPNSRLLKKAKPTKEYMCHETVAMEDYESPFEYRILLMVNQVRTLFINDFDNINDFSIASQTSQAEAMKYFIEKMRKDYKRNGGIIWWNILDGWPQVSEALLDYYFNRKKAYDYVKICQSKNLLMMNEDPDGLNLYFVSEDDKKHRYTYEIIDAYQDKLIDSGSFVSSPRDSIKIKKVNAAEKTLLILKYKDERGKECTNHFHTHIIDIDLFKYLDAMKKYY